MSDVLGESGLFSQGGNSQLSLSCSGLIAVGFKPVEEFKVLAMQLDVYIEQNRWPITRWVKIDTEGAEIRILQRATKILRSSAGMICELHSYAWHGFGNIFFELKALAAAGDRLLRNMVSCSEIGKDPFYRKVFVEQIP